MTKSRSIFEDVGEAQAAGTKAAPTPRAPQADRKWVRTWLMVLFALVVLMIAIGGITRLTDSGLSITEWLPIRGILPPLAATDWLAEFDKYKAIPEFQLQNQNMTLEEFKVIYWWEWGHRALGRLIGLVWAVGLVLLLIAKQVPVGWVPRLVGLGLLGGLQGAIGWWMVSSGLSGDRVDVASYRLAVHLGLAFAILGLIAWYYFSLTMTQMEAIQARRRRESLLSGWSVALLAIIFIQVIFGALVAGIDAGLSYTDWPTMGGGMVPPDMFALQPVWRNFLENAGLVQFIHRCWGYLVLAIVVYVWFRSRKSGLQAIKRAYDWVLVALFGQIVIGIGTLLYTVPLSLALIHQLGAVVVLVLALRARFLTQYPPEQKITA